MEISQEKLNLNLEEFQMKMLRRYLEYPKIEKPKFVIHNHWRGFSVHADLRLQITNDSLIGWTILIQGCSPDKPVLNKKDATKWANSECNKLKPDSVGVSLRAEEKLVEPIDWISYEGRVPKGHVGATRFNDAFFFIYDSGFYEAGAYKPLFFEYFLNGNKFKNVRVVVRGIRTQKISPETKKPIPNVYEIMWKFSIPKNQEPYTISKRAKKKNWYPPKGIVPIPRYWLENKENRKIAFEWFKWVLPKWGIKINESK